MLERRNVLLPALLVVLPVAWVIAVLVGSHWYPSSDWSIEVLRIREVGTSRTPVVGVPSRFGWDHPGPAMFYALAPFNWLFGTTGILVGAAVVNGACAVGGVVLAARRHVALGWLTAAALVVLFRSGDHAALVADPWNPWMAVIPFLAFVLSVWCVAERDWKVLPWMVGLGSFAVQTHVGYLPFVLAGWVLGLVVAVVGHGSPRDGGRRLRAGLRRGAATRRPVIVALVVFVAMWVLPVAQEYVGNKGNLGSLWHYFTSKQGKPVGAAVAWKVMGNELRWLGPWVSGKDVNALGLLDVRPIWSALSRVVVALALGAVAARLRRSWAPLRLAVVLVAMCGVGVAAVARIDGAPYTYLARWSWALSGLVAVSMVWSAGLVAVEVWRRLRAGDAEADGPRPARQAWALTGLGALAVVGLVVLCVVTSRVTVPEPEASRAVGTMTARIQASGLDPGTTYLVRWNEPQSLGAVGTGVAVELIHRGVDAKLGAAYFPLVGTARTAQRADVSHVIWIVDRGDGAVEAVPPGATHIAGYDALTPAERRRAEELLDHLLAQAGKARSKLPADIDLQGRLRTGRFDVDGLARLGFDRAAAEELHRLVFKRSAYDAYMEVGPPQGPATEPPAPGTDLPATGP